MSTPDPAPAPDPTLSSDARWSTYEPATGDDVPDQNPPPGPTVIQTPGKPGEVTPNKSSKTSSSTAAKST